MNLDPAQDKKNVGPDLGPNYLQRLSVGRKKLPLTGYKLTLKLLMSSADSLNPDHARHNLNPICLTL